MQNQILDKLDSKKLKAITTMLSAKPMLRFDYPWGDLESSLEKRNETNIRLIAYGSLLNKNSAHLTLSDTSGELVIAFGVKRVFNYLIPGDTVRYGKLGDTNARAALNVEVTGNISDYINGIMIEVKLGDIQHLRERETAYDLLELPFVSWNLDKSEPSFAFILHCPYSTYDGQIKTSHDILPHMRYYSVCREGAANFGNTFLNTWLDTTYLADTKTKVIDWEKKNTS